MNLAFEIQTEEFESHDRTCTYRSGYLTLLEHNGDCEIPLCRIDLEELYEAMHWVMEADK